MGDRCSVYMEFGGRISVRAAEKLVKVLDDHYFHAQNSSAQPSIENLCDGVYAEEVNYANTDEVEAVCRAYGIAYEKTHGAGGDYGEGISRYLDGRYEDFPANEGVALVPLSDIMKTEQLVSGWADLMDKARFMAKPFPFLVIDPALVCTVEDDEDEDDAVEA